MLPGSGNHGDFHTRGSAPVPARWRDGSRFGVEFATPSSRNPRGSRRHSSSQRLDRRVVLRPALGDNIIHADHLSRLLQQAAKGEPGATVFAYQVRDRNDMASSVSTPAAVPSTSSKSPPSPPPTGLSPACISMTPRVGDRTHDQTLGRGELEITDLNKVYFEAGTLRVERLSARLRLARCRNPRQPFASRDLRADHPVPHRESVGCPEEVAFRMAIFQPSVARTRQRSGKTDLGRVLMELAKESTIERRVSGGSRSAL